MTAASRELVITYGGFALTSGTNGIHLDASESRYSENISYDNGSIEVDFLLVGSSKNDYNTKFNAMWAALRKPNQILTVVCGTTRVNWDPTLGTRTAFVIRADVKKPGNVRDSDTTGFFKFTVTCKFLSDLSGLDNRVPESSFEVLTTIAQRRVAVGVSTWTGNDTQTALQVYAANGNAYYAAKLPSTSGAWVLAENRTSVDDETATLRASRTYWEVLNGLKEYEVGVHYDTNSSRTVTISGTYTATSGNTARDNYSNVATGVVVLTSTIMTSLGITYYESEPIVKEERQLTFPDDQVFFKRVIKEIIYKQSLSLPDTVGIRDYDINVSLVEDIGAYSKPQTKGINRLKKATCNYMAILDKQLPAGYDQYRFWSEYGYNLCIATIKDRLRVSSVSVEGKSLTINPERTKIEASMSVFVKGTGYISAAYTETISDTSGIEMHDLASGEEYHCSIQKGFPVRMLSKTFVARFMDEIPTIARIDIADEVGLMPGDSGNQRVSNFGAEFTRDWDQVREEVFSDGVKDGKKLYLPIKVDRKFYPFTMGNPEINFIDVSLAEEWRWVKASKPATIGPGDTTGTVAK